MEKVGVGFSHSCALLKSGDVGCWGYNPYGQPGLGSTTSFATPHLVDLGAGLVAKELLVDAWQTCVIMADNSVKCWGQNSNATLGVGDTTNRYSPTSVTINP